MIADFRIICENVCDIARSAGKFIKSQSTVFKQEDILVKGLHDYVSYVDKTSEEQIVERLKMLLPSAGFLAEEGTTVTEKKEFTWIIDPLDGTTNFMHGIPFFSVSIALMQHQEIVAGVVYEVNQDECFYACKDGPAYLNGDEIRVSSQSDLGRSLLSTGFPYYDFSRMGAYLEVLKYFIENTSGLRRPGSAATDLAYVACGRFDGFFEYGLHPWDVAAGSFLVQRAGGRVSTFAGNNDFIYGSDILACNDALYSKIQQIVSGCFNS
ncbi:MAG: inositol monophosphatase [Bacteroidales bacterium]|jgi:myo-inositol-1(or 4)-monophosphatase|nr:inositol monophosphatase [Bacteroidales bacterium]